MFKNVDDGQTMDAWYINPIVLRKAKIICNFGLSECNRVKLTYEPNGSGELEKKNGVPWRMTKNKYGRVASPESVPGHHKIFNL